MGQVVSAWMAIHRMKHFASSTFASSILRTVLPPGSYVGLRISIMADPIDAIGHHPTR
jgi:hypothetical protein